MACGKPVVASKIGANCNLVKSPRYGYLCETHNEWMDALANLATNAVLRLEIGRRNRGRIEECYSIANNIADMRKVFDKI